MLFHNKTFTNHDDYMSPAHVWQDIEAYIPKDKTIWECFYGDGTSGQFLQQMGCDVIHEQIDFFKENRGDILVSNPPFSMKKEVYTRLKELDKPFIMVSPSSMICYKYFRELFKDSGIQILIPRRRINFVKLSDGKTEQTKGCNFDCFYYCYKMGLPTDIVYL